MINDTFFEHENDIGYYGENNINNDVMVTRSNSQYDYEDVQGQHGSHGSHGSGHTSHVSHGHTSAAG